MTVTKKFNPSETNIKKFIGKDAFIKYSINERKNKCPNGKISNNRSCIGKVPNGRLI